jgi:hypothetical protein
VHWVLTVADMLSNHALGLVHELASRLLRLRGWALWCLSDLGDNLTLATHYGQPLLADRERVQGPDHPDTLTTRHNLALAYQDAGRTTEADTLRVR